MFQAYKYLTFDVVGTLIDFETGILEYIRSKTAGLDSKAILEAYAVAEHHQHQLTPRLPFPSMLAAMYKEMASTLDLPATEEDALGFRLSIPHWPAFPDSIGALRRLRKYAKLVAMTNSDNWALDHFVRTLEMPFDMRVTAEDVEWNKPDPQFWAYVRGKLGCRVPDVLHVAQSQYHDIVAAKQLGYSTCWIERRMGQQGAGGTPVVQAAAKPDLHFATLQAFADFVEAKSIS
jgi:putative hydrolase of the HAD superfamily